MRCITPITGILGNLCLDPLDQISNRIFVGINKFYARAVKW